MNTAEKLNPPLMPSCEYIPAPYAGPSREEVIAERKQFCNPALFTYYKDPVMIVDGHMQWLFDETGRRYLDLFAGIVTVSVGHCHPKVMARAKEQLDKLQHGTTIYLHPNLGAFAKKLASKMPGDLGVTYFVNSGSEANDLAMLMARLHTGNHDVIALQNAYHGGVNSTMGLTSHHTWKYPVPQGHGVHHVINPDPYRSPLGTDEREIIDKSVDEIHQIVKYGTPGTLAGFIAEPIQGVGGVRYGRGDYLKKAYEAVRSYDGVCIADEVQTGFGRTGEHFWGFQNFDVIPDIVTMAKGIGNGIPLAAVTTTKEIAEKLAQRIHFNTYGGNPVSMAQGMAVLEVIEEDNIQAHAKEVGGYFKAKLLELMERFSVIGEVRGMGLMLGVEFVKDRASKEPATELVADIYEMAKDRGVLLGKGCLDGNVLRIKPPMCITKDDVDFAVSVIGECINELSP